MALFHEARRSFVISVVAVGCSSSGAIPGGLDGGRDVDHPDGLAFGDVSVPDSEAGVMVDRCHVPPDGTSLDAPTCTKQPAPPSSFDPVLKWSWTDTVGGGKVFTPGSMVTPLVANLTDDNHDGEINLCDVPDVIVTTGGGAFSAQGTINMLAGDTGKLEVTFELQGNVDGSITPAIGDIDGDGIPEVVANDTGGHLVAFSNAGKVKWVSKAVGAYTQVSASYCHAIAIHDLDGDGKPEIIVAFEVYDHQGNLKFGYDESKHDGHFWCPANTAADLDGDGKLEVIFGNAALHADGTTYWTLPGPPGQPHVASFDASGLPQLFIAREDGILVVSHDGTILSGPTQLYDAAIDPSCWSKPGVINDFDGDGHADIGNGSCQHMSSYHVDPSSALSVNWKEPIGDISGLASSTAFDFLGRGTADGVYGDESHLWVFDGLTGSVEMSTVRASGTLIEYPVVVDVDNDGSADILVVSNAFAPNYQHTLDVWEDSGKRWVPTRRIWNQHAYYVTNVREDGTIPPQPLKSWLNLNTFRSNAEIEGLQNCVPPVPNPH